MLKFIMRFFHLCDHKWYHVRTFKVPSYYGSFEYYCWIFCPKCEKEKKVYQSEWERIDKKQQILEEYEDGTKQDIS